MTRLALKAWRDLLHLRGQAIAIALVIASGVANLVMSTSTYLSLEATRARFYADYGLADAWASAVRVPEDVAATIAALPGVQQVETRVVAPATLAVDGFADPVRAEILSLPEHGGPGELNRVYLRRGRLPDPDARDEVVLGEAFAAAHGFRPGDRLTATLRGHRQRLTVVGIALSPERVYQIQPGAVFPDFRRYAVLWMNRRVLEASLDLDGAFNSVALRIAPGQDVAPVLAALDRLLARYGGLGAYDRRDQLSNRFLSEELHQLATMARIFPTIFLGVAAFLLNVVMARLIGTQRDQVAILKAFGYRTRSIALHYLGLVGLIALAGTALGIAGGAWLGHLLAGVYQDFYRFPFLDFHVSPGAMLLALLVSLAAAMGGALGAVLRAAALPPAEAMRPPAPPTYRRTVAERLLPATWLRAPGRIALREIGRRPVKAALSVVGLALAGAIMMVGRFQNDSIEAMNTQALRRVERQDWTVAFADPVDRRALFELAALPGVARVEPLRAVSVRLIHGEHRYRTAIEGLPTDARLKRILDVDGHTIAPPSDGLILTGYLRGLLGVEVGDRLQVEVLQGRARRLDLRVSGFVDEYIGAQGYMEIGALTRLIGEPDTASGARLTVAAAPAPLAELDRRPRVIGVGARLAAIQSLYETMGESILVFTFISLLLGGVINFGVVYNAARIALSERGRELASLRVLGYTRAEVGSILYGELGTLVAFAIPLGWLAGTALCYGMVGGLSTDLFRVPAVISSATCALSALTMALSTLVSMLLVRRRVARLDLIAVLKTRE